MKNGLVETNLTARVGRKAGVSYTFLTLEVARLTGIDRKVVKQVLDALPKAILSLFDRADRFVKLSGLGFIEYRYRHGDRSSQSDVNQESRWQLVIRPDNIFARRLRQLLGRPTKFRETYVEAIARRRQGLTKRYEEVGATSSFNNRGERSY